MFASEKEMWYVDLYNWSRCGYLSPACIQTLFQKKSFCVSLVLCSTDSIGSSFLIWVFRSFMVLPLHPVTHVNFSFYFFVGLWRGCKGSNTVRCVCLLWWYGVKDCQKLHWKILPWDVMTCFSSHILAVWLLSVVMTLLNGYIGEVKCFLFISL
jgi:hypothetical protein